MSAPQFDFHLDRTSVRVRRLDTPRTDVAYWLTQPVARRVAAVEFLRQQVHGVDYAAQRMERVLTAYRLDENGLRQTVL